MDHASLGMKVEDFTTLNLGIQGYASEGEDKVY